MPFYAGTSHILQPNPILGIPDLRQSTNPQISVKAQPHADLLSSSFRFRAFSQFICHGNRHSTGLQGISARAMASICVHRGPRTPPDSTPGHICSRDDLQEESQPATHSRQCPIPRFPAIYLTSNRRSRGLQGISARAMFCRKLAELTQTCHTRPYRASVHLSCNSSGMAIAILGASRASSLARWHRFVSIEHREPLQTSLQGTSARAMVCRKNSCLQTGC